NMSPGQAVMMIVGLLLLYLAINKKFEPLLLVPIGFGGILANIPEAGLALTALENAIHFGRPEVLAALAPIMEVDFQIGQTVTPEVVKTFKSSINGLDA